MSEILLVCLGAFCQQGSARDPSTHAARIILLVFFLLAAISYTAYSASIISYISFLPSIEKENYLNKENFIRENNLVLHRTRKIKNILQVRQFYIKIKCFLMARLIMKSFISDLFSKCSRK